MFNDDQPADGQTPPVYVYSHDDGGCSVSGGAVARDTTVPNLAGWYVFGDYCSGDIWAFDPASSPDAPRIVTLANFPAWRRSRSAPTASSTPSPTAAPSPVSSLPDPDGSSPSTRVGSLTTRVELHDPSDGVGRCQPNTDGVARVHAVRPHSCHDGGFADLDPGAAVVLVGDDGIEHVTFAAGEHDRFRDIEHSTIDAVGQRIGACITVGQPSNAEVTRRAPA